MNRPLAVFFACLSLAASLHAATVVVSNDEWLFNDAPFFNLTNNDQEFAANLALLLTAGNTGGNCKVKTIQIVESPTSVAYPEFDEGFIAFLQGLGYNVPTPLTAAPSTYVGQGWDAVLIAGNVATNTALNDANLIAYVNAGGSVFLEGGTGDFKGSPALEAAAWNPFLNAYGLAFATKFNLIPPSNVDVSAFQTQPPYGPTLFGPTTSSGAVSSLYIDNGQDILPFGSNPTNIQVFSEVVNGTNHGLYGAWRQPWIPLTNQPGVNVGAMLQLRDGRILVHEEQSSIATDAENWWILTPDACGSYVNGTWTSGGQMPAGYAPYYFSSQVLLDGRTVVVEGGEYNLNTAVWTSLGACAHITPFGTATWIPNAPPVGWSTIGNAQSVVLASGEYMQANCCTPQNAVSRAACANNWNVTGNVKQPNNDGSGFTLLNNDQVLTVDAKNSACGTSTTGGAELYTVTNPTTGVGTWSCTGQTPIHLYNPSSGGELGAAVLTYYYPLGATVGNVWQMGGDVVASAVYQYPSWVAGPTPPSGLDQADGGPSALEPNGMVLTMLSGPVPDSPPCQFMEFYQYYPNLNSLTNAPNPMHCPLPDASFYGHLMILPTGQIMFTDFSGVVEVYTPTPGNVSLSVPNITGGNGLILSINTTYQLTGTGFNGLTQNNAYGDGYQGDTNYPLVRFTCQNFVGNTCPAGGVYYGFTHDDTTHSIMPAVATTTNIDIPVMPLGQYCMVIVANGVASNCIGVQIIP